MNNCPVAIGMHPTSKQTVARQFRSYAVKSDRGNSVRPNTHNTTPRSMVLRIHILKTVFSSVLSNTAVCGTPKALLTYPVLRLTISHSLKAIHNSILG